jgi:peptidoglycan/xylan/chitin deacetylase (PgdA/CDA1 family)
MFTGLLALSLGLAACGGGGDAKDTSSAAAPPPERPLPTTATAPSEPEGPASTTTPQESEPTKPQAAPRTARPVAIQQGSPKGKRVALTFDADMTPDMLGRLQSGQVPEQFNREVIRQLTRTNTPATLFITGMWAQVYPKQVEKLARDPLFTIGNHTYDHKGFTGDCYGLPSTNGPDAQRQEVVKTQKILKKLTGQAPFWFRYPGLCHTDADNALVAGEGVQPVDGLGSGDAFQSDPQVIVSTVLGEVRPGSIIVMHMMGGPNAPASGEALKTLIPALKGQGYDLVSLDRLIPRK